MFAVGGVGRCSPYRNCFAWEGLLGTRMGSEQQKLAEQRRRRLSPDCRGAWLRFILRASSELAAETPRGWPEGRRPTRTPQGLGGAGIRCCTADLGSRDARTAALIAFPAPRSPLAQPYTEVFDILRFRECEVIHGRCVCCPGRGVAAGEAPYPTQDMALGALVPA